MPKLYRIELTPGERDELTDLTTSSRKVSAKKVIKAQALLLSDESDLGPAYTDEQVREATGMKSAALVRLRQRVHEVGPLEPLHRKPQITPSRKKIVDGEVEARITQIACSEAPDGRNRWTLKLIAEELIALEVVDSISYETVRTCMKKKRSNRG